MNSFDRKNYDGEKEWDGVKEEDKKMEEEEEGLGYSIQKGDNIGVEEEDEIDEREAKVEAILVKEGVRGVRYGGSGAIIGER